MSSSTNCDIIIFFQLKWPFLGLPGLHWPNGAIFPVSPGAVRWDPQSPSGHPALAWHPPWAKPAVHHRPSRGWGICRGPERFGRSGKYPGNFTMNLEEILRSCSMDQFSCWRGARSMVGIYGSLWMFMVVSCQKVSDDVWCSPLQTRWWSLRTHIIIFLQGEPSTSKGNSNGKCTTVLDAPNQTSHAVNAALLSLGPRAGWIAPLDFEWFWTFWT